MKIAIFVFSAKGMNTARKTAQAVKSSEEKGSMEIQLFTISRLIEQTAADSFRVIPQPSRPFYEMMFRSMDALIFVGAAGIAVRSIAPYVRDKQTDPAVLCIDELGKYVIPVLSGHIGGANALAEQIAGQTGAIAVITTATDINRRFSVDAWASGQGFIIDDIKAAKAVSAAILERDVPMMSELPATEYPQGIFPMDPAVQNTVERYTAEQDPEGSRPSEETGILVSWEIKKPFRQTLRIIPRIVHLGIGCRKGTSAEQIRKAVDQVLEQNHVDPRSVMGVYSIDLKAQEEGLKEFCKEKGWEFCCYTAEELRNASGEFSHSDFVQSITGVDNVCERAAMIGAKRLVIHKTAADGVTVAAAVEERMLTWEN